MGNSARKTSIRTAVRGEDDPHDAIEREFLGLWLGLARLREHVRRTFRPKHRDIVVKPAKQPARRKPRRKAA